jgi:integrase
LQFFCIISAKVGALMASLQNKANRWYCAFMFGGQRHTIKLGAISKKEAEGKAREVEMKLLRLSQGLITVPEGIDLRQFMFMDGMAPKLETVSRSLTLKALEEKYTEAMRSSLEASTLQGIQIHFKHLCRILGSTLLVPGITMGTLQTYINERSKERTRTKTLISPATIKKELISLRTAWNWAVSMTWLKGRYPTRGLKYPKGDQKPPFMTYDEVKRTGASWESLYLQPHEVKDLLGYARDHSTTQWIYPMLVTAAYTGARRSELIRAKVQDVNFAESVFTIHERKRVHGTRTTRRVTMTKELSSILKSYLDGRLSGPLFVQDGEAISRNVAHDQLKQTLKNGKWKVVKGLHTLRHSLVSALAAKGIDQRVIDDIVGHQSDEQRRRYRHLTPDIKREAITTAFA